MYLNRKNWIQLVIALCIILLQVLQPFIHVHLDVAEHAHSVGFHMGGDYEHELHDMNLPQSSSHQHFIADTSHLPDVVSVASGIKKEVDQGLSMDLLTYVLVSFCFFLLLPPISKLWPAFHPHFHESLKRRLPASRAPPQR